MTSSDEFVKSPRPSLQGAKRCGNLTNIRPVTRLLPPSAVALLRRMDATEDGSRSLSWAIRPCSWPWVKSKGLSKGSQWPSLCFRTFYR